MQTFTICNFSGGKYVFFVLHYIIKRCDLLFSPITVSGGHKSFEIEAFPDGVLRNERMCLFITKEKYTL